jgi:hypothetical protein
MLPIPSRRGRRAVTVHAKDSHMNRIALFLGALLVGIALTSTGASAHSWGHGWFGWHHGSAHYGWRYHAAAAPAQAGPFCWVDTDSTRGFGFYKVCPDGARPAARGHHRHHRHHR